MNISRRAPSDRVELRFLKICRDEEITGGHNNHRCVARLQRLANRCRARCYIAIDRRAQQHLCQVMFGHAQGFARAGGSRFLTPHNSLLGVNEVGRVVDFGTLRKLHTERFCARGRLQLRGL